MSDWALLLIGGVVGVAVTTIVFVGFVATAVWRRMKGGKK